jgi:hypothetical protein
MSRRPAVAEVHRQPGKDSASDISVQLTQHLPAELLLDF